jgi:hypothetical protein
VRTNGTTFCLLALLLFGAMGRTPPPAHGAQARPIAAGPVSVPTGSEIPRARALPASAAFSAAVQESQHGGGTQRPASGPAIALALDRTDLRSALWRALPPRVVAFALRGLIAHPPTAPPVRIA